VLLKPFWCRTLLHPFAAQCRFVARDKSVNSHASSRTVQTLPV